MLTMLLASDYNTRFSGIRAEEHSKATLDLKGVRRALDALISADTVLIGHALDNDMRALRMVHKHIVDTIVLFPHNSGAPFRRKLQDL
jgi:RNA exonuclease 1